MAAIGATIGHEISHSFDNGGALFDSTGALRNWWTPADFKKFQQAGDALAAQFDQYEALPGLHVNGKLTLGENIADVAGLAAAYDAYRHRWAARRRRRSRASPATSASSSPTPSPGRSKSRPETLRQRSC